MLIVQLLDTEGEMEYTEVYFTTRQKMNFVKQLKKKNFEIIGICDWSETWFNPSTDERVVLVRG